MLNLVEIRTVNGTMLSLPLREVISGILIEEINGLGPVKANIVSTSFAQQDGAQYQSSRREVRNITMKLVLEPDYASSTVALLRSQLYGFFMPKSLVSLRFYRDGLAPVDISARVESMETALFTKEPTVDISLLCFDPDFYNPTPSVFSGETTDGEDTETINYLGSVESGIRFTLDVDRTLGEFTIYHLPPNDTLREMLFVAPLVAGDVLKISTVAGDKGATLTRGGVTSSILYGVSPYSHWLELSPGPNAIRVYAVGATIDYEIEYISRYGGL